MYYILYFSQNIQGPFPIISDNSLEKLAIKSLSNPQIIKDSPNNFGYLAREESVETILEIEYVKFYRAYKSELKRIQNT